MNLHGAGMLALGVALWWAGDAAASVRNEGSSQFPADQIAQFAKRVERRLAESGARVAVVSRVGRPPDELPPGVRYTHVGLAVYSEITTKDGGRLPGYAMYNLYQDEKQPDRSELVQDYPVDFFAGVYALEAGIVVPKPTLQQRVLKMIRDGSYRRLHNPHYSVLANPYKTRFQNCTGFVLDVLVGALYRTGDIAQIETDIKAYFRAQPIAVDPLKLALGSLLRGELALSDQQGPVRTATYESLVAFMREHGLSQEVLTVTDRAKTNRAAPLTREAARAPG